MADERDYIIAYRHKRVQTFKVGKFKFEDGILKIKTEAEHEAFLALYEGLLGIDKNNIVEVLQLENERPVNSRRVDGALASNKVVDSRDSQAVQDTDSAVTTTDPTPAAPADDAAGPAVTDENAPPKTPVGLNLLRQTNN